MKTFRQISVATVPESEEAVAALLERIFALPATIYTDALTGESWATVYLQEEDPDAARRKELREGLNELLNLGLPLGRGKISSRKLRQENWAESWKRHFKPIEIGHKLLIRPTWSNRRPRRGELEIVLDPGLSFGTGHHATTAFCLEQLTAGRREGKKQGLLDIGCGSGILSIAGAKLGFAPVHAFDFDPEAVRVCRANAELNGVEKIVRPVRRDLTQLPLESRRRYDVVCANLMFDLLIQERARIMNRLTANGALVLAGILDSQFAAVRKAYEGAGFRLVRQQREKEWESGLFQIFHEPGAGRQRGG
jgi:ribosomal protein L11 methyltransferase